MEQKKILFEHYNTPESCYGIESAWATPSGEFFRLDNILFYAPEYSLNDIVSVENRNGELFVTGLIKESGHSTIRMIFEDEKDVQSTMKYLKKNGCDSEISDVKILISVDIPPNVIYQDLKKYLEGGEKLSKWNFEEACIAHKK